MDRSDAKVLTKLLLDLHDNNCRAFASHPLLSRNKKFGERYAAAHGIEVFFTEKNSHALSAQIESILINPNAGTESPYLLIGLEPADGWIKIFRLVVTEVGSLNAEVVFLKAELERNISFGYRYEHPEIFEGKGAEKHAFFHVQPIKKTVIKGRQVELPGSISWIPTSSPAFFMMASNACEIVLYAVHSACGWECLKSIRINSFVLRRFLMLGEKAASAF